MTYPFAQSVSWIQRTRNPNGSAYTGTQWVDAAPVVTSGVFAPGHSSENLATGDTVTTQPTLYGVDVALPIAATDLIQIGDVVFEVDGTPQVFQPNPFTGTQVGQVVSLKEITG